MYLFNCRSFLEFIRIKTLTVVDVMFRRKLLALDHYRADNLDITKDDDFRSLVIWTEDQKIRHYKIDERGALRDLDNPKWEEALDKYWKDVGFPTNWKEMERSQVR